MKGYEDVINDYGVTGKQIKGLLETCTNFNEGSLKGTGIVTVPFWFQDQYLNSLKLNKALTEQVARLTKVIDQKVVMPSLIVKPSLNLITGLAEPYLPGVTGPRMGDEALDKDRDYFPSGIHKS